MSIRISKKIVAYESISMTTFDPSYVEWDENEIRQYLKNHPMPSDENYSEEDLIFDLTRSEGTYMLPEGIREETIEYIEDLLNELVR
ncbi:MAG: hypothetical protein AB1480_10650 [Nitrospirota bacterium]